MNWMVSQTNEVSEMTMVLIQPLIFLGCINDVANIKDFITTMYGFKEVRIYKQIVRSCSCVWFSLQEDMVILTDDREEEKFRPTRSNIIAAMQWLVNDAEPDDS